MDHDGPAPRAAPLHEGKRLALGLLAATDRRDKAGAEALLEIWDDDATTALALFTIMVLRHYLGPEQTEEYLRETALGASVE